MLKIILCVGPVICFVDPPLDLWSHNPEVSIVMNMHWWTLDHIYLDSCVRVCVRACVCSSVSVSVNTCLLAT